MELPSSHNDPASLHPLNPGSDVTEDGPIVALRVVVDDAESSFSATSEAFRFVREFGRTFQGYRPGTYLLPNDEQEILRLYHQHRMCDLLLDGRLGLAPIENTNRVLDLGTGTGIWAIEFAEANPDSDVLGNDLSPIQPDYIPSNCRFEIEDIEQEWVYSYKFDYIHGRFLCPFVKSLSNVLQMIYDNLQPGGWVEFQDMIIRFDSPDNTVEGTSLHKWIHFLHEGFRQLGRNPELATTLKSHILEAGFINVVEERFLLPDGPWARGEHNKTLGRMQQANVMAAMHGLTMAPFIKGLGWKQNAVEELLADAKKDYMDTRVHAYHTMVYVYGQKPL